MEEFALVNKYYFLFGWVTSKFIYCFLQKSKYVWNKADFDAVNPANTNFLMGEWNALVHKLKYHSFSSYNTSTVYSTTHKDT